MIDVLSVTIAVLLKIPDWAILVDLILSGVEIDRYLRLLNKWV